MGLEETETLVKEFLSVSKAPVLKNWGCPALCGILRSKSAKTTSLCWALCWAFLLSRHIQSSHKRIREVKPLTSVTQPVPGRTGFLLNPGQLRCGLLLSPHRIDHHVSGASRSLGEVEKDRTFKNSVKVILELPNCLLKQIGSSRGCVYVCGDSFITLVFTEHLLCGRLWGYSDQGTHCPGPWGVTGGHIHEQACSSVPNKP